MFERSAIVALLLLADSSTLPAQQAPAEPTAFSLGDNDAVRSVDAAVLVQRLSIFPVLDGRRLAGVTELGRMGMTPFEVLPVAYLRPIEARRVRQLPMQDVEEDSDAYDLRSSRVYAGGEVGFSYGKSTGKYGGEAMQAYIIGTVGNDKVQITAGAAYEESELRFPRRGR